MRKKSMQISMNVSKSPFFLLTYGWYPFLKTDINLTLICEGMLLCQMNKQM